MLLQLVQREDHRGCPADFARTIAEAELDPGERALLTAAAALNAGEPKRALRTLGTYEWPPDSEATVVAYTLQNLGRALDRNWFPGGTGAVLEDGDLERIAGQPPETAGRSAEVLLLVRVAGDVVAMAPVWRSIVEASRRSGQVAPVSGVLEQVERLGHAIAQYEVPGAVAHLSLIHADLLWRAGQWPAAGQRFAWAFQGYQAINDIVGVGWCWLTKGDWSATPLGHPELMGMALDGPSAPPGVEVEPDPAMAGEHYEQARQCFESADAARGVAAVELRLAHLERQGGRADTSREHLDRAIALAERAGDEALARLARVHLAIMAVSTGDGLDPDAAGADVAGWAGANGSYSYARGLARLCLAVARRSREEGEVLRGRAPLRIADAINAGIGAVLEPALVSGELAQLYGGANYRRAVLFLNEFELNSAITALGARPDDGLAWLALVERAVYANQAAVGLRDPDAIAATAENLRRLAAAAPNDDIPSGHPAASAVQATIAQAGVLEPLYRGTRARNEGRFDEADRHFADALARTEELGAEAALLTVVVLATMRRRDEGLPLVRALVAQGALPPPLATELYLRLGAPRGAAEELGKIEAMGALAPSARPWEALATAAEVHQALGDWSKAASLAADGIRQFEEHLARLSRDVLRITATDDITVIGLYTTAIRAELARAAAERDGRDGGGHAVGEAFRLSDRCRGVALADVLATDLSAGDAADVAAAMRSWYRSGVRLASVFEQVGREQVEDSGLVRERIAEAERELDDAEEELNALAPELLRARRQPRPTPALDDIRALLRPDALLVQYHFFDDELLGWAVSHDRTTTFRRENLTDLSGTVHRFHRASADPLSGAAEREQLGRRLSEVVLEPFARELAERKRVVFVPHGGLALLPFHLLPFEGDAVGATRTVSYLPTSSVAPHCAARRAPRLGSNAAIVGDPSYAPERGLRRLIGSRTEAAAIGRMLGAQPLLDDRASTKGVSELLDSAAMAHLATHGLSMESAPNSAELALAGHDRLTIADLMGLDTDLDLAVLSACDTGRGSATAGGDVIGLTRALLGAGAHNVVVSLWPVDDEAACLTMVDFYERLLVDGDIASALAAAQARVRAESGTARRARFDALSNGDEGVASPPRFAREWGAGAAQRTVADAIDPAHPYFWGPFVHVGL